MNTNMQALCHQLLPMTWEKIDFTKKSNRIGCQALKVCELENIGRVLHVCTKTQFPSEIHFETNSMI